MKEDITNLVEICIWICFVVSVMDEDEEEQYSPESVSPRKSIHEFSSVKERKGTPANPRLLSQALRYLSLFLCLTIIVTTLQ